MSIKTLDNITINKIAAGEVIENATSVVKELVENSIDAGAKNIIVEVKNAGFDFIKVSDDGAGITKDDISLAFLEHATSKLTKIEDLEDISSFGFRGEALPSIAAVSDVELITKSRDDNESYGYRYRIEEKTSYDIEEVASNYGTSIKVSNLFKNVPARKKFLKKYCININIMVYFALEKKDNLDKKFKHKRYFGGKHEKSVTYYCHHRCLSPRCGRRDIRCDDVEKQLGLQ